jgi:hypothetical protein
MQQQQQPPPPQDGLGIGLSSIHCCEMMIA